MGLRLDVRESLARPFARSQAIRLSAGKDEGGASADLPSQSIFDHATFIPTTSYDVGQQVNLGLVFSTLVAGFITEILFWKTAADPSTTHTVGVYDSADGFLLGSALSTGEAVGTGRWIAVPLDPPVYIEATHNYIAAVYFPQGGYSATPGVHSGGIQAGDIDVPSSGASGGNGRYLYVTGLAFPSNGSANGANYGIDIGFRPYTIDPWPAYGPATTYPAPDNTGITPGSLLVPRSGMISLASNATLENVDLAGHVVVNGENCTIRNCRIRNSDAGVTGVVRIDTNVTTGEGLIVDHCEIDGTDVTVNGVMGLGTITDNKIIGVQNGINVYGAATITGNYINVGTAGGSDPHYDGIEMNAGTDVLIEHNTILCVANQTSTIMMNNEFGPLQRITITDNHLSGGGYTVYCDNRKSEAHLVEAETITITDNRVGTGLHGYFALYTSGVLPTGNFDAITGEAV